MESPQMYDNSQSSTPQIELKKVNMATSNNNNNNSTANNNNNNATVNNNNPLVVNKQQGQLHIQQALNNNNNNNTTSLLQKQILQQYSQSDLEELASQEISLDLQHLIDDQFRESESLGIFSDIVSANTNANNNTTSGNNVGSGIGNNQQSKVLHVNSNRISQGSNGNSGHYPRSTLAYMPQPVHSGASYTNNSSDENSSIGSDGTNIKEEPADPHEFRRIATSVIGGGGNGGAQFMGSQQNIGIYPIPPNYASNGSGNSFTTLSAVGGAVLHPHHHHHGVGNTNGAGNGSTLPHLSGAGSISGPGGLGNSIGAVGNNHHLANLAKHKQLMTSHHQRKQQQKHVDKGTDEYRRRRERNNIAVRKSREKAKVRSREVEEKVKALIKEKDALIRRLEEMTNEIQLHKQLYVHLMNHNNPEVNNICRNVLSLVSNGDHGM